jgi:hypothetical protein
VEVGQSAVPMERLNASARGGGWPAECDVGPRTTLDRSLASQRFSSCSNPFFNPWPHYEQNASPCPTRYACLHES